MSRTPAVTVIGVLLSLVMLPLEAFANVVRLSCRQGARLIRALFGRPRRRVTLMISMWAVVVVASAALACVRTLIALQRSAIRRSSIERIVARLAPGSRIVDRDADGAVLDITVGHDPVESMSSASHRQDGPAG